MTPSLTAVDILAAELTVTGPKANATSGTPVESELVLFADGASELGIWEVTPGSFPARKSGVCELMHFVAGSGTITDADGTVHEIAPGVAIFQPDGWEGMWTVTSTVRKSYAIYSVR
ncbi:MAG: cupin domain-containing protein [Gaiellales bacterium]